MLDSISDLTHKLRGRIHRHFVERRLLEVVARLPDQPESRSHYQRLLDEHLELATAQRSGEDGSGRRA